MAVMLARFISTYPVYTAETALQMPWRRFLALVRAIPAVVAEQQLRLLETMAVASNPGETGEQYSALAERLLGVIGHEEVKGSRLQVERGPVVRPGMNPAVRYEAEPGSIEAEMARQAAAWERMQRERNEKRVTGSEI